jgi:hypothetical protein
MEPRDLAVGTRADVICPSCPPTARGISAKRNVAVALSFFVCVQWNQIHQLRYSMDDPRVPVRASFVQLVEFGLLKRMTDNNISFVIVGSTAAYSYGIEVSPKDIDFAVEYQRETWQRILTLAEEEDPQPGGERRITGEPKSFPTQLHFGLGRGIDVLSGLQHASFAELYSRSKQAVITVELLGDLELPIRVTGLGDLVESWRTRGSSRDLDLIRAAEMLAAP